MIEELEIRDLGVIAHSVLELGPGFTAITGETGAGKTMVVAALGLLMGERSDAGMVRTGAERARITGVIRSANPDVRDLVADAGGDMIDGEVILGRTVSAEGRSRATVGGAAAPASTLGRLAPHLFVVHGQADQLRLTSQAAQRDMVDRFGGDAHLELVDAHRAVFAERSRVEDRLETLTTERRERLREAEQLRAELEDIRHVEPVPGEEDDLRVRIERLGNTEHLRQAAVTAQQLLSGDVADPYGRDAVTLVAEALSALDGTSDPELHRIREMLTSVSVQMTEAARDLATFTSALDEEGPEELQRAGERLDAITALLRKYGTDIGEVLAYAERAEARLAELDSDDFHIEQLTAQLDELKDRERDLRERLTAARRESAQRLGERVTRELRALALPDAVFSVDVHETSPTAHGTDRIDMMLQPHPGAAPRPVAKGASGGELSRVMLALEVVIAASDPVPTFVFDEVDAGVGGGAAIEIGRRLQRLAESSQVIVVTHLAQVAAFADRHLRIEKDSAGGFTESSCRVVDGDERLHEMARLLSGMTDSRHALEHAAELLRAGRRSGE